MSLTAAVSGFRLLAGRLDRHRPDRRRQHHPALHALHLRRLSLQRKPAPTARPLLPVDGQGQRQDSHSATPSRAGAPLQRVDRQRPQATGPHRQDARRRHQSHRPDAQRRCRDLNPGFNRKLSQFISQCLASSLIPSLSINLEE